MPSRKEAAKANSWWQEIGHSGPCNLEWEWTPAGGCALTSWVLSNSFEMTRTRTMLKGKYLKWNRNCTLMHAAFIYVPGNGYVMNLFDDVSRWHEVFLDFACLSRTGLSTEFRVIILPWLIDCTYCLLLLQRWRRWTRARHSRKPPGPARSDGCCRKKMNERLESSMGMDR